MTSDMLLVFGAMVAGGLLAWAIIRFDPSRRRARAARSARPASTPLSWTDTAARAWLFGKVAQFVIFFVAIAALFFWRLFAH